jgi:flagellar hook-associated protein 2
MGLRVGGLSSGLDTNTLIDALMTFERRPLVLVEERKTELETQRSLFQDLNTKLVALRDAAAAIDNLTPDLGSPAATEEFLAYTATSAREDVLTATASTAATPGTTEITVNELARAARHGSSAFSDETVSIATPGDTIDITHGGADPISITVGAAGASLLDLRDLINSDMNNGGEVRASVIFDGTGHRLLIAGTSPGLVNDVSVATTIPGEGGGAFFDATVSSGSSDAKLEAYGIPVTRDSNSIVDLIPGVSLELLSADIGVPVQVQVSRNDEEIESKVQGFIDAYNDVVDFLERNARYDAASEVAGPLLGDATIRSIEQRLQRTVVNQYEFAANPFVSLGQMGVEFGADGKFTLDAEQLQEALTTDASSVRQLLSGDGVNPGIATALSEIIDPMVDPDPALGTIRIRTDGFDDRISAFDIQIERLELRLEQREQLLVQRFTQLETLLAQIQNQGSALSALQLPRRES